MVQLLRALEDLGLVPSMHLVAYGCPQLQFQGISRSLWSFHGEHGTHICMQAKPLIKDMK